MHVQFTVFTPNASSSAGISVAVGSGIHCTSFMPVNATAKKAATNLLTFYTANRNGENRSEMK